MTDFLPMPTEFVSEEILQERRKREADIEKYNMNKFNFDRIIRWNMQNCTHGLSKYDVIWKGKYK